MRKDNFGICLSFYAVLAFVLAMLHSTIPLMLLLGFVIVVHKDQWLSMQVMQAFFLSMFYGIIDGIIDVITGIIRPFYSVPILGGLLSGAFNIIDSLIYLIIFVFAIIGISKVAKEQDANIPVAKTFAEKAFGLVKNVTYTQSAPVQNPAPVQNNTPVQNPAPTQEAAPAQESDNNNSYTLN